MQLTRKEKKLSLTSRLTAQLNQLTDRLAETGLNPKEIDQHLKVRSVKARLRQASGRLRAVEAIEAVLAQRKAEKLEKQTLRNDPDYQLKMADAKPAKAKQRPSPEKKKKKHESDEE